jgi:hypothetical protein
VQHSSDCLTPQQRSAVHPSDVLTRTHATHAARATHAHTRHARRAAAGAAAGLRRHRPAGCGPAVPAVAVKRGAVNLLLLPQPWGLAGRSRRRGRHGAVRRSSSSSSSSSSSQGRQRRRVWGVRVWPGAAGGCAAPGAAGGCVARGGVPWRIRGIISAHRRCVCRRLLLLGPAVTRPAVPAAPPTPPPANLGPHRPRRQQWWPAQRA